MRWAIEGGGIVLRSLWDARSYLEKGELVAVLPEWRQEANIWAVYPSRLTASARVRVCLKFMEDYFAQAALRL